jgi:RNA polymerase sigma factor (sigma-70 family)
LLIHHAAELKTGLDGAIPREWQSMLSVEDVLQQAFMHVFLNISKFKSMGTGSFSAWVGTIAKNTLAEAVRALRAQKRGGSRKRVSEVDNDESYSMLFDQIAASNVTPSWCAAKQEACLALQEAIEQLPELSRKVVIMYDIEGRPAEEVASALGRSLGAMYMIRARAHDRLADLLGSGSDFITHLS